MLLSLILVSVLVLVAALIMIPVEKGIANCFAATVKTLEMFDNGAKQ